MKKRVHDLLKGLPEDFVILVLLPSQRFQEANVALLKRLLGRSKVAQGSYITINRPYKALVELFRREKINPEAVNFIDCVTEELHEKKEGLNCYFIDSPASLTEIGIALDPLFKRENHEFVILDSLDMLSAYNDREKILRFVHFLTNKFRLHKLKGVIISLKEETDRTLLDEMGKFCDKVIDLS